MPTQGLFSAIFSSSPASPPHPRSHGSHSRTSAASASSSGLNSTCRTNSTSSSWITNSDTSVPGLSASAASQPLIKSTPIQTQSHDKFPSKSKLISMLSAVDRRRKQTLPPIKQRDLTTTQAALIESFTPMQDSGAAPGLAKMQPRGATEREDHSSLRTFLDSNPAKPEDKSQKHVPMSQFDWEENSDDDSGLQARKSHLRSLQRVTRRWQAAGGGKLRPSDGLFGTGLSVESWMESAQKLAEGRRNQAQATNGTGITQNVDDDVKSGSPTGYGCLPIRRKSVLKLFDDPVWSNGDDITRAIASEGCEAKEAESNQDAAGGTSSDSTAQRSCSDTGTTGPSSLYSDSPTKGEVKVDWFFGPEVSPNGFRYTNWNRYGRGVSAIHAQECSPSAARILDTKVSDGLSEKIQADKTSKTSMIKRLKSQLFETTGAIPDDDSKPKDVFADMRLNGTLDRKVRRFNNDLDSPTRDEKRLIYVPGEGIYPSVSAVEEARGYKSDLKRSLSSKSSSIAETKAPPPKGYPKGPEDPNWDDAVKRVKKIVREREKRESEEARQQQKQLKIQEKKLKRLKAGKDVVFKGSQLGLTPKKPLDEITEDEFEAVGAFAETPAKETSLVKKSGIFSTLFTKILGSTQEKEAHVENIKLELERHKSLELLNTASVEDIKELSMDDRAHYEKALRALNGEGSPFDTNPESECRNSTSDDKDNKIGSAFKSNTAVAKYGVSPGVGLGITANADSRASERSKPARTMSYQEFITLKRRRENSEGQDDSNEGIDNGLALSDIVEEDVASPADREIPASTQPKLADEHVDDEDDDGSSWCTESIYSLDEIERLNEYSGSSAQYQSSGREVTAEVVRHQEVGGHQTPQFSGHYALSSYRKNGPNDDTASIYSENIDMDVMPAPLQIRVLKVRQSGAQSQPPHTNSFIPDRKASFRARIQEVSRLQEAHIGGRSHPALRGNSEDDKDTSSTERSSNVQHCENGVDFRPKRDSLDSGIGSMSDEQIEQVDEGYATGDLKQYEQFMDENLRTSNSESDPITSAQNWEGGENVGESGQTVDDVDLGALRTEVGLGPLRLASLNSAPNHPHHPFTWTHEKVMCRQVHNPAEILPQMPALPHAAPVSVSRMDSEYFKNSAKNSATGETNMCQGCGSLCCRFANLLVTSKINTAGDLMEELVRAKAQQRVNMLRTSHPNGIEEYETFIQCANCNQRVCPKCAKKCTEQLCQAIVCADCRSQSETCPVHQ